MENIQVNEEKNPSVVESESPANRAGQASLPWKWETGSRTIRSRENYWLATMDSWDGQVNNDANAELIVRAVNSHDALVAGILAIPAGALEMCADDDQRNALRNAADVAWRIQKDKQRAALKLAEAANA